MRTLSESIGTFPMPKLRNIYNKYSVFLNINDKSAMPRSRGEALMGDGSCYYK